MSFAEAAKIVLKFINRGTELIIFLGNILRRMYAVFREQYEIMKQDFCATKSIRKSTLNIHLPQLINF